MIRNLVNMAGASDFLGDPEDLEEILRDVNIPEDKKESQERPGEKAGYEKVQGSKEKPAYEDQSAYEEKKESQEKPVEDPESKQNDEGPFSSIKRAQEIYKMRRTRPAEIPDKFNSSELLDKYKEICSNFYDQKLLERFRKLYEQNPNTDKIMIYDHELLKKIMEI